MNWKMVVAAGRSTNAIHDGWRPKTDPPHSACCGPSMCDVGNGNILEIFYPHALPHSRSLCYEYIVHCALYFMMVAPRTTRCIIRSYIWLHLRFYSIVVVIVAAMLMLYSISSLIPRACYMITTHKHLQGQSVITTPEDKSIRCEVQLLVWLVTGNR